MSASSPVRAESVRVDLNHDAVSRAPCTSHPHPKEINIVDWTSKHHPSSNNLPESGQKALMSVYIGSIRFREKKEYGDITIT